MSDVEPVREPFGRRCCGGCLVALLITVGVWALWRSLLLSWPREPHDPVRWRAASAETRGTMVRSVLLHHLHKGMTFDEVARLLGPPFYVYSEGPPAHPWRTTLAYDVRHRTESTMFSHYARLKVVLDGNGRLSDAYVANSD
jgi:hypothetical protein